MKHLGIAFFLFLAFALASPAFASCTSPSGAGGDVFFNSDESVLQYCNEVEWVSFPVSSASDVDPCENPTGDAGELFYNADDNVLQWCDGNVWHPAGPVGGVAGAGCNTPSGSEGDIIYNSSQYVLQYCEGDAWIAVAKPFVPTDLEGLVTWFDGVDASTITEVSAEVSQWDDKSGQDNHAFNDNSTVNSRPSYDGAEKGVVFNRTDKERLRITASLMTNAGYQDTFFVVAKHNGASSATHEAVFGQHRGNALDSYGHGFKFTGTTVKLQANSNSVGVLKSVDIGSIDQTRLYAARAENQNTILRVDGAEVASDFVNNSTGHPYAMFIGGGFSGSLVSEYTSSYNGTVYEVIMYDRPLSDDEIDVVENYLADKWDITLP